MQQQGEFTSPGPSRGSFEWIRREGKKVGAVLRTREKVNPLFISPGHRIDLLTSIHLILESCLVFRFPEPLRKAHQASCGRDPNFNVAKAGPNV